jgi:hypothetical protein
LQHALLFSTKNCNFRILLELPIACCSAHAGHTHCISVMRAKVIDLNELIINKHIGKLKVKCSEIPHYAYT